MLGASPRADARAGGCRPEPPPSLPRAAARVPRRARAARPRMRFVPTLSVEWAAGGLRFRLDVPEQDLAEPLLEEVRHPLDEDTLRALEQSADALLRGAESAGFPDEARARGAVLYRTLVPSRLRPRLRAVRGPLLISTALYGMPWELLHDDEEFWGLRYGLGKRLVMDRALPAAASARLHPRPRALGIGSDPPGGLAVRAA